MAEAQVFKGGDAARKSIREGVRVMAIHLPIPPKDTSSANSPTVPVEIFVTPIPDSPVKRKRRRRPNFRNRGQKLGLARLPSYKRMVCNSLEFFIPYRFFGSIVL